MDCFLWQMRPASWLPMTGLLDYRSGDLIAAYRPLAARSFGGGRTPIWRPMPVMTSTICSSCSLVGTAQSEQRSNDTPLGGAGGARACAEVPARHAAATEPRAAL